MTTIDLTREQDYRRDNYGVLLTSKSRYDVVGKGVHNPHHRHSIDVWENQMRDDYEGQAEAYKDPMGRPTVDRYSFLLSPHASVISDRPTDRAPDGGAIEMGGLVQLKIEGFGIGWFQVMHRPSHDPHLVPVDIATSASRQFYIDSGEYLERDLND